MRPPPSHRVDRSVPEAPPARNRTVPGSFTRGRHPLPSGAHGRPERLSGTLESGIPLIIGSSGGVVERAVALGRVLHVSVRAGVRLAVVHIRVSLSHVGAMAVRCARSETVSVPSPQPRSTDDSTARAMAPQKAPTARGRCCKGFTRSLEEVEQSRCIRRTPAGAPAVRGVGVCPSPVIPSAFALLGTPLPAAKQWPGVIFHRPSPSA